MLICFYFESCSGHGVGTQFHVLPVHALFLQELPLVGRLLHDINIANDGSIFYCVEMQCALMRTFFLGVKQRMCSPPSTFKRKTLWCTQCLRTLKPSSNPFKNATICCLLLCFFEAVYPVGKTYCQITESHSVSVATLLCCLVQSHLPSIWRKKRLFGSNSLY